MRQGKVKELEEEKMCISQRISVGTIYLSTVEADEL